MALPSITEGQIAIDPANRIFYYIDSNGNLVNSSLNLLQESGSLISTDDSLTILGNTTTIESTVTVLKDPIITLGGKTAPSTDDNKDRGIEFRWHDGTSSKVGFFGFDDSTGKFTFIPDATNTSEVFSGSLGEIDANISWENVTGKPTFVNSITGTTNEIDVTSTTGNIIISLPSTAAINISGTAAGWTTPRKITLAGDLDGNVIIDGGSNVTLTANIVSNAVTLGTDTSGDYVANLTAGTGITITSGTGEQSQPTIAVTTNTYDAYGAAATAEANAAIDASAKAATAYSNAVAFTTGQLGSFDLDDLADVNINTSITNSYLKYNGSAWVNDQIDLGVDTNGNYVQNLVAGTGIGISNNTGEAATPTISLNAALTDLSNVNINLSTLASNQSLTWDGTNWINSTPPPTPDGYSHSEIIGNGVDNEFYINFPFIEEDLFVSIQSAISPYEVIYATWEVPQQGQLKVTFAQPPANNSIKVTAFSNISSSALIAPSLGSLSDVMYQGNGHIPGDVLYSDGNGWHNHQLTLDNLADVNVQYATPNQYLKYNGNSNTWVNATLDIPEINNINDIGDVNINSANNGQVLMYNGSAWVNSVFPTINTLDDIGDVTITGLQTGHFLKWNSTEWVNEQIDLGSDTVGNYMSGLTAGTGVVITHTPSAGSIATISIGQAVGTASNVQFQQVTTTGNLSVSGSIETNGNLTIGGNLIVMGNTVTFNTETIVVEDKTIELGTSLTPSNITADGSGIVVPDGSTNKTFTWINSTASWSSSENINLAAGKVFKINNVEVLSANGLPANSVTPTMLQEGPARASFRSQILTVTDATYTLGLSDLSKLIIMNNSSAMTVTIPSESNIAFATGDRIDVTRYGTGSLTFNSQAGVSLRATPGLNLRAQYSTATLTKLATNEWLIVGDLAA